MTPDGWTEEALVQDFYADVHELRALTDQAWELRDSPYLLDACQAIVDWHERRFLRRYERRQERAARLVRAQGGSR
jgi:hypothetical protein